MLQHILCLGNAFNWFSFLVNAFDLCVFFLSGNYSTRILFHILRRSKRQRKLSSYLHSISSSPITLWRHAFIPRGFNMDIVLSPVYDAYYILLVKAFSASEKERKKFNCKFLFHRETKSAILLWQTKLSPAQTVDQTLVHILPTTDVQQR